MESDSITRSSFESALEALATWYVLRGRPEVEVLSPVGPGAPEAVRAAWSIISAVSASDWLTQVPSRPAAVVTRQVLSKLTLREREILRLRVFADEPLTLDELGLRFQLTRERIRQVETRITKVLRASDELADIRALSSQALNGDDVVTPLDVVLGETPSLTERVGDVEQPLWRILDRLDDSFEVRDGWWCRDSTHSAIAQTKLALRTAAESSRVIKIDDVPMLKGRPWSVEWVQYCGISVHEGYVLLSSSGIPDRAAVTLEVEGSPMSGDEIALRLGSNRSVRSVKNALAVDSRFVRVDRNSWALESWGLETYQSIRQLIADEVEAQGGAVRLSRLVASLTDRFSISATSVMGYASAPPFATVDGIVELASANPTLPRKSPFDTRRLFRLSNGWALRFGVTSEHLRGSGSPLPSALIGVLGLRYGEAKYLACRYGEQRLGWSGPQATLGSIKRILDGDDVRVGDTCFAMFGEDGTFDVHRIVISDIPGPQRAFELAGLTMSGASASFRDLMEAVGLPPNASSHGLAEKLRMRGDYDVADCVATGRWR